MIDITFSSMGLDLVTLGWTKAIRLILVFVSTILFLIIEYANTAAPSKNAPSFVIVIANATLRGFDNGTIGSDDSGVVINVDDDDDDDDNDDDDDDDDDKDVGAVNGTTLSAKNFFSNETSSLFHTSTMVLLSLAPWAS